MKNWRYYIVPAFLAVLMLGCRGKEIGEVELKSTQEQPTEDKSLYTPSTQSLLRGYSWMEEVSQLDLKVSGNDLATISLSGPHDDHYLKVVNLYLDYLVPRLHYHPADPPDAFDALNLKLAEFSRNSLSVPYGKPGDEMAHYETNLEETIPWKLKGDYDFTPNKFYKPLRVSVTNNCLSPGLWELNANDRSGEIYHGWFNMPNEFYYQLTAKVNQLDEEFVKKSVQWEEVKVKLALDRLREIQTDLGNTGIVVADREIGFSSQGSRKKISNKFVAYDNGSGAVRYPEKLSDLYRHTVLMSSFIEPGIYSEKTEDKKKFDFTFLSNPKEAAIKIVTPKTSYNWNEEAAHHGKEEGEYIEMDITLASGEHIIIGNLPLKLLVEQEDFLIHGFGVGILSPEGLAERQNFLIKKGPCPSFAYLAEKKGDDLYGLNSHARGIEQIYIRSHPNSATPYWDVILTSYERIVDLVQYQIEVPKPLVPHQKEYNEEYIPPIYFTYRDDNVN